MDIVALNNSRTTFQRLSDAKFFNGWVKGISPGSAVIHTCTACQPAPGDEFAFQVYGNKKDAFFHARLVSLQGADPAPIFSSERGDRLFPLEFTCQIVSDMSFKDSQGQPRFCVEGVSADIMLDDDCKSKGAIVVDLGPGGLAVLADRQYRKSDCVRVSLFADGQLIEFDAEVRSCVTNALNSAYYRVGVQIQRMSRVDTLRWRQLYSAILDANRMLGTQRTAELGTVVKLKSRFAA